ncbi:MAG: hypothetical protein AB1657_01760 [Candidatus Micrarchaeota archaeon]
MASEMEIREQIMGLGFSETDAEPLANCIVTKKSCSWVNTDDVDNAKLQKLGEFLKSNGYKIRVSVEAVPTRGKYIWEVKAFQ